MITKVSNKIADPSNVVFTSAFVTDFINQAQAELGRISPKPFQQDLTLLADTLTYQLQSTYFTVAQPEVEVIRAELWDKTTTPHKFLSRLQPAAGAYENSTRAGWRVWDGIIEFTNSMEELFDPDTHTVRVWGYRPYKPVATGSDTLELSAELEDAALDYCQMLAFQMLVGSRDLYTQWQAQSNNVDVSVAGLINSLSLAQESWRRKARALLVLRERP